LESTNLVASMLSFDSQSNLCAERQESSCEL
jgi:hypothetical protein